MLNPWLGVLILIPAGLALAFMLWVLCMFWKASGRRPKFQAIPAPDFPPPTSLAPVSRHRPRSPQPVPLIRVQGRS